MHCFLNRIVKRLYCDVVNADSGFVNNVEPLATETATRIDTFFVWMVICSLHKQLDNDFYLIVSLSIAKHDGGYMSNLST